MVFNKSNDPFDSNDKKISERTICNLEISADIKNKNNKIFYENILNDTYLHMLVEQVGKIRASLNFS